MYIYNLYYICILYIYSFIPQTCRYSTRSSDYLCLVILKLKTIVGEQVFSVAGPTF